MFETIPYPELIVEIDRYLDRVGLSLYSLLMIAGLLVFIRYFLYQLEEKGGYSRSSANRLLLLLGVSLAVTYLCAFVFDGLYHFLEGEKFSEGGLTFISGFLGGAAAFAVLVYFLMKEERKHLLSLFNMLIPGVVLAHAIGRIGCFTAGCCYGKPTDSPLGIIFPRGYYADIVFGQVPVHPTQLYEAAFLILFYFCLKFLPKVKDHKFASYLIGYGLFRALLEAFFRGDDRGLLFGIAPSLVLSIAMVLAGAVILIKQHRNIKTEAEKL